MFKRSKLLALPLLTATLIGGFLTATPAEAATSQSTPQATVRAFFADVTARNTNALAKLYSPLEGARRTVAGAGAYRAQATAKLTSWRIVNTQLYGRAATIRASYKQDGKPQLLNLNLAQGGASGHSWYLTGSSPLRSYGAGISASLFTPGKTYLVGKGLRVSYSGGRAYLRGKGKLIPYRSGAALLPGKYTFVTKEKYGYFADRVSTVTYGLGTILGSRTNTPQLSVKGRSVASAAVLQMLHTCASTIYTDHAVTKNEAAARLTDTYGTTCPSWTNDNRVYDADGGDAALAMFPSDSYENLEPWFNSEYVSHPKFQILSDPQVQVSGDADGLQYKLVGGSYQLWSWLRHYNTDDIFDQPDKDTYEYSWSQTNTFDGAELNADGSTRAGSEYLTDLSDSPVFFFETQLKR